MYGGTDDSFKYGNLQAHATVVESLTFQGSREVGGDRIVVTGPKNYGVIMDKTNFYAEQGGQIGDTGYIRTPSGTFEVEGTSRFGDAIVHTGRVVEGKLPREGEAALLEVSRSRFDITRNHTATHLLNWALRKVLGDH